MLVLASAPCDGLNVVYVSRSTSIPMLEDEPDCASARYALQWNCEPLPRPENEIRADFGDGCDRRVRGRILDANL